MAPLGIKKKKKGEDPAIDGEEEDTADGAKPKKEKSAGGGKGKLLTLVLVIVLVAVALFTGGVIMAKIVLPNLITTENPGSANVEDPAATEEPTDGEEFEPEVTHEIGEMTIQLAANAEGKKGFLIIKTSLGFADAKQGETFPAKLPEIEDIVNSTLMAKTMDELSLPSDVEALKHVLANKIGKLFADKKGNPAQVKILVRKFIMQAA